MKNPTITNKTRRARYGSLRPHGHKILEWCVEGIEWTHIHARLTDDGVTISMAALWAHAERKGWLAVHPYSKHYDAVIAYKFSRGVLNVEDLEKLKQPKSKSTP